MCVKRKGRRELAWIELHEELRSHPKVARLARELGVSKAESRGIVVGLWLWAATYAPDGDLSRFDAVDIADGCDYTGNKDLMAVMTEVGWIDPDHRIHDWNKHGLKLLHSSQARQQRYRERVDQATAKQPAKVEEKPQSEDPGPTGTSQPRDGKVTVTSPKRNGDVTVTSYLNPTSTIPDQEKKLVVDAPKRDPVKTAEEIKDLDFVLRLHDPEFGAWTRRIQQLIAQENSDRRKNPFTWRPTAGSIESDLRGLIYRVSDELKTRILYEAYNILHEKLNWPNYVELAILYTMRTSRKTPIHSPYQFVISVLKKPAEIVSARSDGILSSLKAGMRA